MTAFGFEQEAVDGLRRSARGRGHVVMELGTKMRFDRMRFFSIGRERVGPFVREQTDADNRQRCRNREVARTDRYWRGPPGEFSLSGACVTS